MYGGVMYTGQSRMNSDEGTTQGESGGECMHGQSPEDRGAYLVQLELGVFT